MLSFCIDRASHSFLLRWRISGSAFSSVGKQNWKPAPEVGGNAICFVSLMSKKFILTANNKSETSCIASKIPLFAPEETINKHRLCKDIGLLLY